MAPTYYYSTNERRVSEVSGPMRELHSLAGGDGCPGLHSPGVSQLAGPQETLHQGRLRPELAGPGPGGVRQRGGAGDTEQEAGQSSSQAALELSPFTNHHGTYRVSR